MCRGATVSGQHSPPAPDSDAYRGQRNHTRSPRRRPRHRHAAAAAAASPRAQGAQPRRIPMIDYEAAELCMRRLIVIRNSPDCLNYIGFERRIAPLIAIRYGILNLVLFAESHNALMGTLNSRHKSLVLPLSELVADVICHKDDLGRVRNDWIAHLQGKGEFVEDASEFLGNNGLPEDPSEYYKMSVRAIVFVDTLQALLPDIAGPAVKKFNSTLDARPPMHTVDPEQVCLRVRERLERVRRKAKADRPEILWDSVIGAARVRLEKLGDDDPCTHFACGPGRPEVGGGAQ